jgi:hypothetical protein
VPISALGLALGMIDLWLSTSGFCGAHRRRFGGAVPGNAGRDPHPGDLVVIAFAGGMFIVPLYAILQVASPPEERSRIIAANNIVNAGVTVLVVLAITRCWPPAAMCPARSARWASRRWWWRWSACGCCPKRCSNRRSASSLRCCTAWR